MLHTALPAGRLLQRLELPDGPVQVVIDTDTYNEIDDQFAVVQMLLSPDRFRLQAIYAAPFFNDRSAGPGHGMELSYDEILRLLEKMRMKPDGIVFRGSTAYLPGEQTPVVSAAAEDLVARALAMPDDEPLYVVAIGAITNVASAILLEPEIIRKIVVVWLGGHAVEYHTTSEFNLMQDVPAARLVLDSGVPLVLVPVLGVTSHLLTTNAELELYVKPCGEIGKFLFERFSDYSGNRFAYSKVLWDMAAVAALQGPSFVSTQLIHSPVLTDGLTWSVDRNRHFIRYVHEVHRDAIFGDFFTKLKRFTSQG